MTDLITKAYLNVKTALHNFLYEEDGDVNIVSIVILIGIAVILAIIFRNQIKDLLERIFKGINDNADAVTGGADKVK